MPNYIEYTIVLHPTSSEVIRGIDQILKTDSSQYGSKLTAPQQAISSNYPSRSVTSSFTSSFQRVGVYNLLPSEIASMLNDPNILNIITFPTSAEDILIHGLGNNTTESIVNANFRYQKGNTISSTFWDNSLNENELGNLGLYYHSLPPESILSGSNGIETVKLIAGNRNNSFDQVTNHTNYNNFNYTLTGKNVDVIIYEGFSNPYDTPSIKQRNSAMDFNHPEFYGFDGNTRIQFIDWANYNWPSYYDNAFYPCNEAWVTGVMGSYYHRQMVASSAVGLYNGYAKNANIYFLPGSPSNPATLNTVLTFHQNKPINPKTGKKNPTVVNISMGAGYQYPYMLYELGGKSSGSFTFNNHGHNKGFRISHFGKDFIFVSSSTGINNTELKVNNHNGYQASLSKGCSEIYYYNTPTLQGLVDTLNNNVSQAFSASVNITNNQISITQSTDYRVINPKIYTGSLEDFINVDGYPSPTGGMFITELSGGFDPNTHISKIVVKGNTVFEGTNGYINSNHGYISTKGAPYDQYGIDKGINWVGDETDNPIDVDIDNPQGTGKTFAAVKLAIKTNGAHDFPFADYLRQAYNELAEAGIIVVTSAGNTTSLSTQTNQSNLSTTEFYDADLYDDDLYNTYIEIDTTSNNPAQIHNIGPNKPLRFFTPSIVDNYSIINAGLLNLDRLSFVENLLDVCDPVFTINDFKGITTAQTVRGPGVDTYLLAGNTTMAGYQGNTSAFDFITHTCSFYENLNIPFNTQSVNNAYTQSFMSTSFYEDEYNFTTPTDIHGNIPFRIQGPQANVLNGGTSNAAPRLTGMIACFLELYPESNLNDVRKWIKSIGVPIQNDNNPRSNFLYLGLYQTSSNASKPFIFESDYPNSGSEMPGNPTTPSFPFNKPNPIEISGSLKITGVNFSL